MRVLVTGGTGFIGSALVRHLLAAGHDVRILARTKRSQRLLDGLNVEIVEGNITSMGSVRKAVKDCSVVFDLAAVYAFYPFWEKEAKAMYQINVQGTRNMLECALEYGVKRFIHTSSIATIGHGSDGRPSDERTGFDLKQASHYAHSKYLAEQEVLKYCQKGLPVIILNPAIVIGPRDHKPTPSGEIIVKFLNRSYPAYFDTIWSVADVDDVARAHVAAIDHGRVGERYVLCNKQHFSMKEIFQLLEEISGVRSPRWKIPYPLLFIFVHVEEFLSYTVLKKKPLLPTEGVKFCKGSVVYDNSKAVKELGFSATPIRETLAKAVSWYRQNGYIESRGLFRIKTHGSKSIRRFMQWLKMDKYTDVLRWDTFLYFCIVSSLRSLRTMGLASNEDGWRKVTRVYLRTEESKYALAVFKLDFWSDVPAQTERTIVAARKHLIERLARFLKSRPSLHWKLEWFRFSAQRQRNPFIDIVHAEFDGKGRLISLDPYFDPDEINRDIANMSPEIKDQLIKEIMARYDQTKDVADKKRPRVLKQELYQWLSQRSDLDKNAGAKEFIDRILSATFIQFEPAPTQGNLQRFQTPCFIRSKHPGFGFLNIICRFTEGITEADIWVQYHHIPADGVPMQDVLRELKRQWGACGELKFPVINGTEKPVPELCSTVNSRPGVYHASRFFNFRPFLRSRKNFIQQDERKAKKNITVAALLVWRLAHYRAFDGVKFTIPLDLAETSSRERTLGFIMIRPSIYFDKDKPDGGFFNFQREFNRQLRDTRCRKGENYDLLESFALTPPFMYGMMLKVLPGAIQEFSGTVGLTIIKKAELFISPLTDFHTDGFIAISNFLNPAQDGGRVCNVSIKGPKDKINEYFEAIKEVAGSEIS